MPKTIPLRATLCVKRYHVVIYDPGGFVDNLLLKSATPKKGRVYEIQGETTSCIRHYVISYNVRLTSVRHADLS